MVAIASLPTASQLVSHLDAHVIGQAFAKKRLAMAVYRHYLGLCARDQPAPAVLGFGPQHQLVLGPTGVGKSHLVKTIARLLGVPVAFTAATSLVETGYVGAPVESMFTALIERAGGDLALAERGIVFLDEFDKLRRAPEVSRDVSGEGVQNGLLTLLDGRPVRLRFRDREVVLDSSRVLFLCTGAFSGLGGIVRRRLERGERKGLGFTAARRARTVASDDELMPRATPEDLIEYGIIPELVGRFAGIVPLRALSRTELLHLLAGLESSPLIRKQRLFEMHGVQLEVPDDACGVLVDRALAHGLGARALERVVADALADVEFRLPQLAEQGVGAVRMTRAAIEGRGAPEYVNRRLVKDWVEPFPSAAQLCLGALGPAGRPTSAVPRPGRTQQARPPRRPPAAPNLFETG